MGAGGFQYEGAMAIGNQETAEISKGRTMEVARAALAELSNQIQDDRDGAFRCVCSLDGQSEQIHASEAFFGNGISGKDGLVSDRHAVLVGRHLCTPHPRRTGQQNGVGAADLRNAQMGHGNHAARWMFRSRVPIQDLRFGWRTIGIFRKQHTVRPDDDEGVTHGMPRFGCFVFSFMFASR